MFVLDFTFSWKIAVTLATAVCCSLGMTTQITW